MSANPVTDAVNRAVTLEELQRALTEPIPPDERAEVEALVRWFTTRYSSPAARLSYVRRAYRRWRPGN